MNLHPLVIYFAVGALFATYVGYFLYFTFMRSKSFILYYSLTNHAVATLFSILAAMTGLSMASTQYVQQKAPFLFLFPHKWMGLLLALFTLITFLYMWLIWVTTWNKVR
jgi:uncharacterized membrane protein